MNIYQLFNFSTYNFNCFILVKLYSILSSINQELDLLLDRASTQSNDNQNKQQSQIPN